MTFEPRLARSGLRARSVPWVALSLALLVLAWGCSRVQGVDEPPEPATPPSVALEPGAVASGREAEAARLLRRAREALDAGRAAEAAESARRVVEGYPAAPASGDAAWLLARAATQLGAWEEAAEAANRLARVLPPDDPRIGEVRLLEADALAHGGREAEALDRLLHIPPGAPAPLRAEALERVRELVADREIETLEEVLRGSSPGQPLAAPVMAAYARLLRLAGRPEEARRFARSALEVGARGADAETARAVLSGEPLATDRGPVALGALLPASGSPAVRRLAELVEEGVRTAVASLDPGPGVNLDVRDDGGDPRRALALFAELDASGALGVVGPLGEEAMELLADGPSDVPVVSPTAVAVEPGKGVYSLASPDPGAPRLLARYAARSGLDQVVVLHAGEPASTFEARVFEEAFEAEGGSVLRSMAYEPGTTFFEEHLRQAEALEPQALVLPVPARDVEALAPQVAFFGLDTLEIKVLGTAAWTDPEVLRQVSERHTNGVVVATPQRPGPESAAYRRFVEAYERRFQRTLRNPGAVALGYDAASLLLVAAGSGARTPSELGTALQAVEGFEGATGVLSVQDGRIVRNHHLVCIQDRTLLRVEPGEVTTYHRPMREAEPDEEEEIEPPLDPDEEREPEMVPAGPPEFYCPGTVPPELLSDSVMTPDTLR